MRARGISPFLPALWSRLTRRYHSGIGNGVVESLKTYVVCAVSQPASEERETGRRVNREKTQADVCGVLDSDFSHWSTCREQTQVVLTLDMG